VKAKGGKKGGGERGRARTLLIGDNVGESSAILRKKKGGEGGGGGIDAYSFRRGGDEKRREKRVSSLYLIMQTLEAMLRFQGEGGREREGGDVRRRLSTPSNLFHTVLHRKGKEKKEGGKKIGPIWIQRKL